MVNYASGAAFKAKMAAKLAALDAPPTPPEPEPEPVPAPIFFTMAPINLTSIQPFTPSYTWSTSAQEYSGTPPGSSGWTAGEYSEAAAFHKAWSVNGRIDCDCPDPVCQRAQKFNVPF